MFNGNPDDLDGTARETIDAVMSFYGEKSAQWLSDLTHSEQPWIEARHGVAEGDRCNVEITLATMAEYYASLG
jgi:uncharacterized phage-associated protein